MWRHNLSKEISLRDLASFHPVCHSPLLQKRYQSHSILTRLHLQNWHRAWEGPVPFTWFVNWPTAVISCVLQFHRKIILWKLHRHSRKWNLKCILPLSPMQIPHSLQIAASWAPPWSCWQSGNHSGMNVPVLTPSSIVITKLILFQGKSKDVCVRQNRARQTVWSIVLKMLFRKDPAKALVHSFSHLCSTRRSQRKIQPRPLRRKKDEPFFSILFLSFRKRFQPHGFSRFHDMFTPCKTEEAPHRQQCTCYLHPAETPFEVFVT